MPIRPTGISLASKGILAIRKCLSTAVRGVLDQIEKIIPPSLGHIIYARVGRLEFPVRGTIRKRSRKLIPVIGIKKSFAILKMRLLGTIRQVTLSYKMTVQGISLITIRLKLQLQGRVSQLHSQSQAIAGKIAHLSSTALQLLGTIYKQDQLNSSVFGVVLKWTQIETTVWGVPSKKILQSTTIKGIIKTVSRSQTLIKGTIKVFTSQMTSLKGKINLKKLIASLLDLDTDSED